MEELLERSAELSAIRASAEHAAAGTVDYSPDGGRTWTSVYQGANAGRVGIPGRSLAGSRHARIRVGVNDGFNEPRARSAVFRVDGTRPAARIIRPQHGEPLRAGGGIVLTGAALDDRHRELRGCAAARLRAELVLRPPAPRPRPQAGRAPAGGPHRAAARRA